MMNPRLLWCCAVRTQRYIMAVEKYRIYTKFIRENLTDN